MSATLGHVSHTMNLGNLALAVVKHSRRWRCVSQQLLDVNVLLHLRRSDLALGLLASDVDRQHARIVAKLLLEQNGLGFLGNASDRGPRRTVRLGRELLGHQHGELALIHGGASADPHKDLGLGIDHRRAARVEELPRRQLRSVVNQLDAVLLWRVTIQHTIITATATAAACVSQLPALARVAWHLTHR